jgi:hypothetical protein
MQGIDISNAPAPLVEATKAAILRCWTDTRSLEDAIVDASADAHDNALTRGCDKTQAERLGMFVAAVGAHMQAGIRI